MYFSPDDWAKTIETYDTWWRGELKRPLISAAHSLKRCPQISKGNCDNFNKSPEDVINEIDYNVANTVYFGDGFPLVDWVFFGPGAMAPYLGSQVRTDPDFNNIWFYPIPGDHELSDIHLTLDRSNPWYNRCKDLYWAGVKKWIGRVIIGMNDIGGEMDVVASLIGTERLLYSLIDEPDQVARLCEEVHNIWHSVYWEFMSILSENNPAFADWPGLLSPGPYYTQQCDFSYMIGPESFEKFVYPYIKSTADRLDHTLYHLDGKGALIHLDKLLSIEKIDAVQCVPGDGEAKGYKWIDVYRKIRNAGRKMQFIGSHKDFIDVTSDIGAYGMYFNTGGTKEQLNALFDRFEVDGEPPYRRQ